jgi:hypothetical protein
MDKPELRNQHLRALLGDAIQNAERVDALFRDHSDAQILWKADPTTWSIAECVEHLTVLDEAYFVGIERGIDKAPASSARNEGYDPHLFTRYFIGMVGEQMKQKMKNPKLFDPSRSSSGGSVDSGDRFLAHQTILYDLIERADGRDINKKVLSSPVSSLLRFSLGEALTMLVSHQKRHLSQAGRLLTREGFPGR